MGLLVTDDYWGIATVWQEARGESYEGKVAVAEVILKRTARKYFSDGTVAGTCLRDRQFSGWNNADPNRVKAAKLDTNDPVVQECVCAWAEAKNGSNRTGEAIHYFNPHDCSPKWAEGAKVIAQIGRHRFVIPKT